MVVLDFLNNEVVLNKHPNRIVSLVPSQTELLCYLGQAKNLVGITNFCIHPKDNFINNNRVGGTKDFDIEQIKALNPDLIIANKEENDKEKIRILQQQFPVYVSDIKTLTDAFKMILDVGKIVGKVAIAERLVTQIQLEFSKIATLEKSYSAAYVIWNKPIMVAATDTFINHLLNQLGFENFCASKKRYPEISEKQLLENPPNFIFLASEPYPFKERNRQQFAQRFPNSKVLLVNGEYFSWYGNRLLKAANYFKVLQNKLGIHTY